MRKNIVLGLFVLLAFSNFTHAQGDRMKTAAVVECILLDFTTNENSSLPVTDVFFLFTKSQQHTWLDSIVSKLSNKYSLGEVKVFQKDSVVFTNSSMQGIGKLREKDLRKTGDARFDYYIKIYGEYKLGKTSILGAGFNNPSHAKLSLYMAVFDREGKRIWFPDKVVKGGLGLGRKADAGQYYDSKQEQTDTFSYLFNKVLDQIFE